MNKTEDLLDEVRNARALPAPHEAKGIRRAAGVSQSQIAELLGVNRTTIARWEAGLMSPRMVHRAQYAQLLAALQLEMSS